MTARMAIYRKVREQLLKDRPECAVCLVHEQMTRPSPSVDVHHRAGRNGKNLTDLDLLVPICRRHHQFIHDNPAWSYQHKWLIKR